MNVSISQIVADLNTTVTGVQSAITLYTLVMAAFMLVGAKLGDILGRDRAFGLGLAVYGLGSLITALSPNLTVLLIGWSGIEGLGAVLVIPAIAALTAANYEGKERAFAYGMIGGAAGAAIAAGPLIGGYVTTTWSWRYVFVGEVVVVIAVLIVHRRMKRAPKPDHPPKLDYGGAALSAVALGLIVFGILKSSVWGWITPIDAPTINGHEITPLGFSLVPFLIIGGFVVLGCFLEDLFGLGDNLGLLSNSLVAVTIAAFVLGIEGVLELVALRHERGVGRGGEGRPLLPPRPRLPRLRKRLQKSNSRAPQKTSRPSDSPARPRNPAPFFWNSPRSIRSQAASSSPEICTRPPPPCSACY
jgi:MFS family permease